ncbi:acyl carrier protein [Jatrophihabitans sp.]|uniref:acyl carrier protein n=1 Tax=Jatrophihabitans sp. TaxID=1932789 RepID=UPI002C0DAC6F|nr:acyl carrier protein [Jatrophihabitans sp.]
MTDAASIEHTVVTILSDVLHESVEDLNNHPVLAAYDWDSLSSLEALAQLESQFGVTLDLRSYQAARRISDLVELVQHAGSSTVGQR